MIEKLKNKRDLHRCRFPSNKISCGRGAKFSKN